MFRYTGPEFVINHNHDDQPHHHRHHGYGVEDNDSVERGKDEPFCYRSPTTAMPSNKVVSIAKVARSRLLFFMTPSPSSPSSSAPTDGTTEYYISDEEEHRERSDSIDSVISSTDDECDYDECDYDDGDEFLDCVDPLEDWASPPLSFPPRPLTSDCPSRGCLKVRTHRESLSFRGICTSTSPDSVSFSVVTIHRMDTGIVHETQVVSVNEFEESIRIPTPPLAPKVSPDTCGCRSILKVRSQRESLRTKRWRGGKTRRGRNSKSHGWMSSVNFSTVSVHEHAVILDAVDPHCVPRSGPPVTLDWTTLKDRTDIPIESYEKSKLRSVRRRLRSALHLPEKTSSHHGGHCSSSKPCPTSPKHREAVLRRHGARKEDIRRAVQDAKRFHSAASASGSTAASSMDDSTWAYYFASGKGRWTLPYVISQEISFEE